MPQNGEKNDRFGVYRNLCCGREIIIRDGATFPDCANHPKLTTTWKQIEVEVEEVIVVRKKSKADPPPEEQNVFDPGRNRGTSAY
jgi:hypothetical protein